MMRTLTNTHRLGRQPGRARGAIGQAWQARPSDHRRDDHGPCAAANRSTTWTYLARQANFTGASPTVSFDGLLAAPTMWTKCSARHLATRST